MWQASNQRVKAMAEQDRRRRERQKRPIHFKRISVQAKVDDQTHELRLIPSDINLAGVGVFSPVSLPVAHEVLLTIPAETPFDVHGKIVWSQEHETTTHIITTQPCRYRAGIRFVFASPEEEAKLKAYLDQAVLEVSQK